MSTAEGSPPCVGDPSLLASRSWLHRSFLHQCFAHMALVPAGHSLLLGTPPLLGTLCPLTPEGHPPPPWPSSCPHPHMLDVPGCHSYLPVSCFQCLLSPMTPRCLSLARASPSASGCHGHPEVADRQHHRCPHPAPPQASRGSAQPGRHSRLFWRSHTCRSWSESQ